MKLDVSQVGYGELFHLLKIGRIVGTTELHLHINYFFDWIQIWIFVLLNNKFVYQLESLLPCAPLTLFALCPGRVC